MGRSEVFGGISITLMIVLGIAILSMFGDAMENAPSDDETKQKIKEINNDGINLLVLVGALLGAVGGITLILLIGKVMSQH